MTVQSLERTLDILEAFEAERAGLTLTELATKVGLNKSTTSRLVTVLCRREYLTKEEQSRRYKLGIKFVTLSASFLNSIDLRLMAASIMAKTSIETGQVVYLALLHAKKVIYIDKTDSHSSLESLTIVGKQAKVYSTALGKALLRGKTYDELLTFFSNIELMSQTIFTKTDKDVLIDEILNAGHYTIDNEENELNTQCVAAPIYDYKGSVIAAISISCAKNSTTPAIMQTFADKIVEASYLISLKMGYQFH